jgi:hypothetical protein
MLVLTPSFAPDFELCADLNASVLALTPDDVRHQLVVPKKDLELFGRLAGPRTEIRAEPEFLPGSFVKAPVVNMTVNLRRPFPPVRGWILQQVLKLAATARADADVVLLVDSDIEFVRPFSAADFRDDAGVVRFYRKPDDIDERLPRHVLWHQGAHALLGLEPPTVPMHDYVSSLLAWDPKLVRALLARVESVTGRRWFDAVASQLHFSEWTLYGVFVDAIAGAPANAAATDDARCYARWDTIPLRHGASGEHTVGDFAAGLGDGDLAVMISAKSHTPLDVRRAAFAAIRQATPEPKRVKE